VKHIIAFIVTTAFAQQSPPKTFKAKFSPGYRIPTVDISGETHRHVIVDKEKGQ
jgi:hypothetical protein